MVFVNVVDVCFIIVVFKYIKCVSVIVVVLLVIIARVFVNSFVWLIIFIDLLAIFHVWFAIGIAVQFGVGWLVIIVTFVSIIITFI